MGYINKNIKGNQGSSQILYEASSSNTTIESLSIANVHNYNTAKVNLFIFRRPTTSTTEKFYIIKNLSILVGTTVILDASDVGYNTKEHTLYIELKEKISEVDIKLTIT